MIKPYILQNIYTANYYQQLNFVSSLLKSIVDEELIYTGESTQLMLKLDTVNPDADPDMDELNQLTDNEKLELAIHVLSNVIAHIPR
ncbi:MAG TPA: hypothetical protein V6D28_27970 [Leptolyngbyaceae cyanobacterium]